MSPRKESWVSEINRLIDITIIRLAVLYPVHAASSFARKRRRWWGGKGEDEGGLREKRLIFGEEGDTNSDE
jgi:hypothetical protein